MTDPVHHPAHYESPSGLEAIVVMEEFLPDPCSFMRGNALKYLLRAGKKDDEVQDLEKAAWYIQREIDWRKTQQ